MLHNRAIPAKPPVDCLRERTEGAALGEDEIRHRLASHLIEYGELVAGGFQAFLEHRAVEARSVMERLVKG